MESIRLNLESLIIKAAQLQTNELHNLTSFKKSIRHFEVKDVYDAALDFFMQDALDDLLGVVTRLEECGIHTSYRFKSEQSFRFKWNKNLNEQRPLRKVANDLLGIRLIVNEEIFVRQQLMETFQKSAYTIRTVDFYENPKSHDDGYRGLHFYIEANRQAFPIEIQVWDYKAALLNFYTHEILYKKEELSEVERIYSTTLQKLLGEFPEKPVGVDLSFINYLFGILHEQMKGEDSDG